MWRSVRGTRRFGLHLLTLARGRLLRWRLETFGLYAPSFPHERPWWRVNPRMLLLLLGRSGAYSGWLGEMDATRTGGAEGWWRDRLGAGYACMHSAMLREDAAMDETEPGL